RPQPGHFHPSLMSEPLQKEQEAQEAPAHAHCRPYRCLVVSLPAHLERSKSGGEKHECWSEHVRRAPCRRGRRLGFQPALRREGHAVRREAPIHKRRTWACTGSCHYESAWDTRKCQSTAR